MKNIIIIPIQIILMMFLISLVIIIWVLPVLLSMYADNYWILLLYSFWWIPAIPLSAFIGVVTSEIGDTISDI